MAQHDYVLSDNTGALFRADLNAALAAAATNNSGASEPATTYAYQPWADISAGKLKIRNGANDAWVVIGDLDQVNLGLIHSSAIGTDVQAYMAPASQAEMESGTEVALRAMSPLRVKQAISASSSSAAHGQCRLFKSGSNILLIPYNGNKIIINGVSQTIPAAGVSLAPTGLTGGVYYIYAYMNGGTMTLEASATARATSTTAGNKGVAIKSGDDTRSLVGLVYSNSAAFTDAYSGRLVLSWFNRRNITGRAWLTTNRSTTSTSISEINTEARVYFLTWADEAVYSSANGAASNSAAFQSTDMAIGWDGVSVLGGISKQANTTATAINSISVTSVAEVGQLAENAVHYVVLGGGVSSGTGTFIGSADNGMRCEINILIRG